MKKLSLLAILLCPYLCLGQEEVPKVLYDTKVKRLLPWPRADFSPVEGLEPHIITLTVIQVPRPEPESENSVIEPRTVIDVDNATVTYGWTERSLTEDEIALRRKGLFPNAQAYQVKEWLIEQGVDLANVPSILSGMIEDPIERAKAINRWNAAVIIPRDHPLVNALAAQLGKTPEEIDAAWSGILAK